MNIEPQHRRASDERDDALRDLIGDAVRAAMPAHACLSDDDRRADGMSDATR